MAGAAPNPQVMEEMLRQRGLLATGGNIRMMPFASSAGSGATPATASGSSVAEAIGATPATVPTGTPFGVVDPNNPTPEELAKIENATDDELSLNWPLIAAGAAGSALALLAKSLMNRRGIPAPDVVAGVPADPLKALPGIPTVEGVVEPTARIAGGNIQEGEFTDVAPRLEGQRALPAPSDPTLAREEIVKALGGTPSTYVPPQATQIEDGPSAPKYLTARTLAERKAANSNVPSPATGRTMLAIDEFTDVAPDEMKQAKQLARQLIANRKAGIKEATPGKYGKPSLLDPETALQDVIRVMRENGTLQSLRRVKP